MCSLRCAVADVAADLVPSQISAGWSRYFRGVDKGHQTPPSVPVRRTPRQQYMSLRAHPQPDATSTGCVRRAGSGCYTTIPGRLERVARRATVRQPSRRRPLAVGDMAEVQLHDGLEAPLSGPGRSRSTVFQTERLVLSNGSGTVVQVGCRCGATASTISRQLAVGQVLLQPGRRIDLRKRPVGEVMESSARNAGGSETRRSPVDQGDESCGMGELLCGPPHATS